MTDMLTFTDADGIDVAYYRWNAGRARPAPLC